MLTPYHRWKTFSSTELVLAPETFFKSRHAKRYYDILHPKWVMYMCITCINFKPEIDIKNKERKK
jgi:hypothetical protein